MRKFWFAFLVQFGILAGISELSAYEFKSPGTFVNLRVANLLTPYGLFDNFCRVHNFDLRPFYFRAPTRAGVLEHPLLFALILLNVALAFRILTRVRKD